VSFSPLRRLRIDAHADHICRVADAGASVTSCEMVRFDVGESE
jgi:hypothetical protein